MSILSWNEKALLYHELLNYTKAGIGLVQALEALEEGTRSGRVRRVIGLLNVELKRGIPLDQALKGIPRAFEEMEITIFEAASQSGRLEQAFGYLGSYFERLKEAQTAILVQSAYPLFILHLGVFLMALPELVAAGGLKQYLWTTLSFLTCVWVGFALLLLVAKVLNAAGVRSAGVDRFLCLVPIFGGIRKASGLSRFLTALEMQIQAGINPIEAVVAAAKSSRRGQIFRAAAHAVPRLAAGRGIVKELSPKSGSGAFPDTVARALESAEASGALDTELKRWAEYYHAESLRKLEAAGVWVPKILFLIIAGFVAYKVVGVYSDSMKSLESLMDPNAK